METILLSIGSNTFAKTNIDKAKRMLTFLFSDIVFSDPILSEPDDDQIKYLFRNILASFETTLPIEDIIDKIKQIERAVGRTPKDKYLGKVVIDIDLIKYGEDILRPLDLEKEYIQQLLAIFEIPEPSKAEQPDVNLESESSEKEIPGHKKSDLAQKTDSTENKDSAEETDISEETDLNKD